jgi:adenylate/guanylate cyclase family protein/HAMP domain-containing protein
MTREILRPVIALVGAARKVASGDLTAQVEWKWKDELGVLSDTFNSMTKSIREKTELIEQKNRENERLLLNILPSEIANRLKEGESEIADNFADVTVLFGDLVGFTALSSKTPAAEIVEMLNGLFSRFDQAAKELGIEKIKTIGDCYMAVCGLPSRCSDHAHRMARMALRMVESDSRIRQGTRAKLAAAHWAQLRPGGRRCHRHYQVYLRPLGRYGKPCQPHGINRSTGSNTSYPKCVRATER